MEFAKAVSETALITLAGRAAELSQRAPLIVDPVAGDLVDALRAALPPAQARLLDTTRRTNSGAHMAIRGRQYDRYARAFRRRHPDALVVNLGAGFDTRYWRLADVPWPRPDAYVELDLPDVIAAKRALLGDRLEYRTIGRSVLDEAWIAEVAAMQRARLMFIAEGLFMYLPPEGVTGILGRLADTFRESELVFENVTERYTRGVRRRLVAKKLRRLGVSTDVYFTFGLRDAREIERWAKGIRVLEEWSYFEAEDAWPPWIRVFRHFKSMTRLQWTVRASLG